MEGRTSEASAWIVSPVRDYQVGLSSVEHGGSSCSRRILHTQDLELWVGLFGPARPERRGEERHEEDRVFHSSTAYATGLTAADLAKRVGVVYIGVRRRPGKPKDSVYGRLDDEQLKTHGRWLKKDFEKGGLERLIPTAASGLDLYRYAQTDPHLEPWQRPR